MSNKKILVADNDIHNIQPALKKLREKKYDIINAYDGIQVVKLAHAHNPDLIILSANMPGGGLSIFENLKFSIETALIPIILLTDVIDEKVKKELIKKGAHEVISKPIDDEELVSKVQGILGDEEEAKGSPPPKISSRPPAEEEQYSKDIKSLYEVIKSQAQTSAPGLLKRIKRDQKMILVVDDEPDVNSLLALLLKSQGYQVITAIDGQQGLEKARKEKPDLIILDIMLPKLDGYRVARMLKFDEHYKHIPIIMLTAKIQDKDKETGLEMGADAYLTKPFDTEDILDKVKNSLAKAA